MIKAAALIRSIADFCNDIGGAVIYIQTRRSRTASLSVTGGGGVDPNAYVAEDGSTPYVAEDGTTFYVTET